MRQIAHVFAAQERPLVAFVGPVSRTWHEDVDVIIVVLEALRELADFRIVLGGRFGFDLKVLEAAALLDLEVFIYAPEGAICLAPDFVRAPDMLDGVCLVVAFPAVTARVVKTAASDAPPPVEWVAGPVESADTEIVGLALRLGVPVLSMNRNGALELHGG